MERSAIDSDHLKIIEALRRISCGQNDSTIRSATGLSLDILSLLRQLRSVGRTLSTTVDPRDYLDDSGTDFDESDW
jgi:hypothetical protein